MRWLDSPRRPVLPAHGSRRLTSARLRRSTPLPNLLATTWSGRLLARLTRLFTGRLS
ncbi:hypothetical protein ACPOLB_25885 [Rubrivivax sp. RP6-9]|uniref:hypothetical protein n=1 Tax=Rubrivivax sp. RP6-9 TaxID=3415750 RepID=UPI003CC59FC3